MLDLLDGALTYAGRIVAAIPDSERGAPTPCETFDVEQLTAHLIGGLWRFAALPATGKISADPDPDLSGEPLAPAYDLAARAVSTAWTDEHLDTVYDLPFGPATGAGMAMFLLIEVLGHGWDLAVATGQPAALDDSLASAGLVVAKQLGTSLRADDMMAAPHPTPPDASTTDRLIAYLGRAPDWRP